LLSHFCVHSPLSRYEDSPKEIIFIGFCCIAAVIYCAFLFCFLAMEYKEKDEEYAEWGRWRTKECNFIYLCFDKQKIWWILHFLFWYHANNKMKPMRLILPLPSHIFCFEKKNTFLLFIAIFGILCNNIVHFAPRQRFLFVFEAHKSIFTHFKLMWNLIKLFALFFNVKHTNTHTHVLHLHILNYIPAFTAMSRYFFFFFLIFLFTHENNKFHTFF
jgi:hypothetical protein